MRWALHAESPSIPALLLTTLEVQAWVSKALRNLETSLGTRDRRTAEGWLRCWQGRAGQAVGVLQGEQTTVLIGSWGAQGANEGTKQTRNMKGALERG